MANDTQRDKARATFGKTFFENSKAQPQPKNSFTALQARANARPIPTFKVGGVVKKADGGKASKDFTGLMSQAAARAAKKGMPVMKAGGPTKEHMAKRIESRMEAGAYKKGGKVMCKADGGEAKSRYDRKMKDIEKDYRIALAKGKNEGVAKAKMEQRVADAKDDLAKWTKSDRSATSAAEKAAEAALTEARKTKGQSIMQRDAAKSFGRELEAKAEMPKKMATTEMVSGIGAAPSLPGAKTEKKVAMPAPRQVSVRRQVQATGATKGVSTPGAAAAAGRGPVAQPTENKDTREIVVVGRKPKPAQKQWVEGKTAGERMGNVMAAPFKAAAKYNPLSLAASAIFDGEPSKPAAPSAPAPRNSAQADRKADYLKRAQAERAAGREGNARYYEREASYLKNGGKPGKYAAGGAGKVRKGMMKGK